MNIHYKTEYKRKFNECNNLNRYRDVEAILNHVEIFTKLNRNIKNQLTVC